MECVSICDNESEGIDIENSIARERERERAREDGIHIYIVIIITRRVVAHISSCSYILCNPTESVDQYS